MPVADADGLQGRLMSFYGAELQKYTSYKGHASEPVKQILFTDKGVLSVSAHKIGRAHV